MIVTRFARAAGACALAVVLFVSSQPPVAGAGATVAFVDVAVVPMDRERVLEGQTVVVRDGRIAAIGPAGEVPVPAGADRVDGRGRYLIPGLCDMYAHVNEANLALFLANGITTVRNTAPGLPAHLALRDAVASGRLLGPRVITTGPAVEGQSPVYGSVEPVTSAAEGRSIVREHARMGYDGVMIYSGAEPSVYLAVLDAARQAGLPVSGHLPYKVPRELFWRGGQRSKENLVSEVNLQSGGCYVPAEALGEYARQTAASGVWTIPTLTIHKVRALRSPARAHLDRPEMRYVPPRQRAHWLGGEGRAYAVPGYSYSGAPELVRRLREAGARLLLGTDAGYPFVVAGFSIHDELANLVEVGASPYEALRAATRDAAEYLGELDRSGTVAAGKRADLVLLEANPLESVANVARRAGVMIEGRWLPESRLRADLVALAASWDGAADRFAGFDPLPAGDEVRTARYEIRLRGTLAAEERLAVRSEGHGSRELVGQASVDPHLGRRIALRVRFGEDGSGEEAEVTLREVGEPGRVRILGDAGRLRVSCRLPYYGDAAWDEAAPAGAVFVGPTMAINLDVDLLANYYLVLRRVGGLEVGGSAVVPARRVELNSEEFGRRSVMGELEYFVLRDPDDERDAPRGRVPARRYRIYQPGLNGAGLDVVRVAVGDDGMIVTLEAAGGALTAARVD